MSDSLISKCKSGDVQAFEELVTLYQNQVFSLCFNMLSNNADADDATQLTFIKVYKHIKSFKEKSKFTTWLYRIATNTCLDLIRQNKKNVTISADAMGQDGETPFLAQIPSEAPTPLEAIEQSELRKHITECIEKLPTNARTIIVLREIKQLEYDEIARILRISMGTVKSRLNRAREQLQKLLEERMGSA